MPTDFDLGTLTVVGHDIDNLSEAFGIQKDKFNDIVALVKSAWNYKKTISESIEYLTKNSKGSELVLALVFFGRLWEYNLDDEDESE